MALTQKDKKWVSAEIQDNNKILIQRMFEYFATKEELKETEDRITGKLGKMISGTQDAVAKLDKKFEMDLVVGMMGKLARHEETPKRHVSRLDVLEGST